MSIDGEEVGNMLEAMKGRTEDNTHAFARFLALSRSLWSPPVSQYQSRHS